ncbi:UDP-glucose 6-dehydrogenase [Ignavibacterium album JCM 16511]|uniref:UDP-glucose 6-dehydrogenase n=1 Tax=Ignavibacterium album (strain DSM 19864 / JCM 16511 / NBRC 101810 / Mat9-16) TaxID=945713 RepID=I0AJF7_IGNAJ|nr:UDP-glucose/GDP-mannose dehydrogenase family protein [Ignavibacterium album]AFH49114.1 UDP-glucose 6-dehydrogenase [Ignavibacterium album JCM 16511]
MKLAVIGTGYVGLVSGTCFAEMGNNVICVDNNREKLKKLNNGQVTIYEPGLELLYQRNFNQKRLRFTDNLKEAVDFAEAIFLCLPTPQGEDGSADLTHVMEIADQIGNILKQSSDYKLIVNKSTVPVGTVAKVKEVLTQKGAKSFDVASNPEFLREGFAVDDFMKPDRIVIGAESEKAFKLLRSLYEPFVRQGNPIIEMDIRSAEVTKYAANSYLATRITFMNELANFCEKAGANVDLVRKGMGSDTRIGKRFLFPGIGYGGSCFPKDVNALIKTSLDFNSELTLLTLVDKINKEQRLRFFNKIKNHFEGNLKGKRFAVWGLAFKPNTDDMREAPSIPVIKMLLENGAKVKAFDPAAMTNSKFYLNDKIEYADNMYDALPDADALLIFTEWNEFRNPDFTKVKSLLKEPLIFDGRNVYDLDDMEELGFTYYSIGRKIIKGKNL